MSHQSVWVSVIFIFNSFVIGIPNLAPLFDMLHLQHCALIVLDGQLCVLMMESLTRAPIFIAACHCSEIRSWKVCDDTVAATHPHDCSLSTISTNHSSKLIVHRHLCDLSGMAIWNPPCKCSQIEAVQKFEPIPGFPGCFPLSNICSSLPVCGHNTCLLGTVSFVIRGILLNLYTVNCDCHERESYCYNTKLNKTSSVHSWSTFSSPVYNCSGSSGDLVAESRCIDPSSGEDAVDCLGPGLMCCPPWLHTCRCDVARKNGVALLRRFLGPCKPNINKDLSATSISLEKPRRYRRSPHRRDRDSNHRLNTKDASVKKRRSPSTGLTKADYYYEYEYDSEKEKNDDGKKTTINENSFLDLFAATTQETKAAYEDDVYYEDFESNILSPDVMGDTDIKPLPTELLPANKEVPEGDEYDYDEPEDIRAGLSHSSSVTASCLVTVTITYNAAMVTVKGKHNWFL